MGIISSIINKLKNYDIEWWRLLVDFVKWVIGGAVIIIAFCMIRPREQDRLDKSLQLEAFKAYLSATDTKDTDLWQRKLNLIRAYADKSDSKMLAFINEEQNRIKDINYTNSEIAKVKKEYDKIKADKINLMAIIARDKSKFTEVGSKISELDLKLKQLDNQKKTYTEKLTSYGIVNANVTLPSVGLTIGANPLSVQSPSIEKKQNPDIHNANVPLTGQGGHGGVGP